MKKVYTVITILAILAILGIPIVAVIPSFSKLYLASDFIIPMSKITKVRILFGILVVVALWILISLSRKSIKRAHESIAAEMKGQ